MIYREIATYLLDFIENFLSQEKIYKVSLFNNELQELRKQLFLKEEENRLYLGKINDFNDLNEKFNELMRECQALREENRENETNLVKIKDFLSENPKLSTEECRMTLAETSIELQEKKLVYFDNFISLLK